MKRPTDKKIRIKHRRPVRNELDFHNWPTKMEIHHLLSGKSDLKLKTAEK